MKDLQMVSLIKLVAKTYFFLCAHMCTNSQSTSTLLCYRQYSVQHRLVAFALILFIPSFESESAGILIQPECTRDKPIL